MSTHSASRAAKKAKQAAKPAPLVFDAPGIEADLANRADLDKLAEQIKTGSASVMPDTHHTQSAEASSNETKPGPVLAEPPKSRTWDHSPGPAYPVRPTLPQVESRANRPSDAVDVQLRAISARLPRLIEQAVNELEARSKAELDRRWTGSMKAFEERLAAMEGVIKESGPGSGSTQVSGNEARNTIQQLEAENKGQLASISFYKVAFCMLLGAVVFGAALFFHFLAK